MTYQSIQEEDNNHSVSSQISAESASTELASIEPVSTEPVSTELASSDVTLPDGSSRTAGGWQNWVSGPRGLLIGLALGLGLALIGARLGARQAESSPATAGESVQVASATVTTARAERAPVRQTITTNGTVEAFDLLSVAPRANGLQIQSVNVREGDRVSAGQVMAVLDDSVIRSQISQAQAQVVSAQAQVAQARAQAAQAEAAVAEARENFDRYNSLFEQGAVSAEELTSRRTEVTTEGQTVGSAYAAVESAVATVRSREAEVERLTTQLDQTLVLAPSSGVVAEKSATVGDTASTGTPLFKIIDGDQLELSVQIPQSQLAQVAVGTPVQVRSNSNPDLQLQGQVRSIDPTVDAQTRQATVKVGLPGSDRIKPGMFLQAAIVTGERDGVVVPAEAVLPQSDGSFVVYTLNSDRTVRANRVDVGDRIPATEREPAKVEVTSGLDENVPVVVEGASYLQDGDLVDVAAGEGAA
ncbi:MAG: efflux RND transporter periplasmic adaptor subunit [Phormidesmis sp.]